MDTKEEFGLRPPAPPPPLAPSSAPKWPWLVVAIAILAVGYCLFRPDPAEQTSGTGDEKKLAKKDNNEKSNVEAGTPGTDPAVKGPTAKDAAKKDSATPDISRPPTSDAPEELYAKNAWGRFAPGSWSKIRLRQTGGAPSPDTEHKDTLKSASEAAIEVQRDSSDKKEPLDFKYQPDFLVAIDLDSKSWQQATRSVQYVKDEELTIAGKKITTKHIKVEYDFGTKKIYGEFWIAPEVPGAIARVITSFDMVRYERDLLEFEAKALSR